MSVRQATMAAFAVLAGMCIVCTASAQGDDSDAGALGIFAQQIDGLAGACAVAAAEDGAFAVLCPDAGEVALVKDARVLTRFAIPVQTGIGPARPWGSITRLPGDAWAVGGFHGLVVIETQGARHVISTLEAIANVRAVAPDPLGGLVALCASEAEPGELVFASRGDGAHTMRLQLEAIPGVRGPSGLALDASGDVYIADGLACTVTKLRRDGSVVWQFGEYGEPVGFLSSPAGLAVHDDRVYVANTRNHRITVLDAMSGDRLDAWGVHSRTPREGAGKLHYPSGVAVTRDGEALIVCEPWEDRVQVFRRAQVGETIQRVKYIDLGAYTHFGNSIALDGQLMTIVQPDSHRILVYDIGPAGAEREEPALIGAYGAYGDRAGQFIDPGALAIDADAKRLYVHDRGNARLCALAMSWEASEPIRFRPDLLDVARSVDLQAMSGQLGLERAIEPSSIALLPDDRALIADAANGGLWIMHRALHTFERVVTDVELELPRAVAVRTSTRGIEIAVTDAVRGHVFTGPLEGTRARLAPVEDLHLLDPWGVAFMQDGAIVVTDRASHIVHVVDEGQAEALTQGMGVQASEVFKPRGCAVSDDGRLFTLDRGNHRVFVWSPARELIGVFGARPFILDAQRTLWAKEGSHPMKR